jgi:hypothetical protein
MGVTVSLVIVGTDESPRWVALVKYEPCAPYGSRGLFCCEEGHREPEPAASHAMLLAISVLVADVRALKPPAAGALALAAG